MMPLIVAIESDRKQASQVTAIARRLHAELLIADATEPVLAQLGARVPDLILTSPLLSPKDEAALAERLRDLDAAAHVPTLTIPVFASPKKASAAANGVLTRLRRKTAKAATPEGCDPAVFAEQIANYLERAASERAAAAAAVEEMLPASEAAPIAPVADATPPDLATEATAEPYPATLVAEPIVAEAQPFEPAIESALAMISGADSMAALRAADSTVAFATDPEDVLTRLEASLKGLVIEDIAASVSDLAETGEAPEPAAQEPDWTSIDLTVSAEAVADEPQAPAVGASEEAFAVVPDATATTPEPIERPACVAEESAPPIQEPAWAMFDEESRVIEAAVPGETVIQEPVQTARWMDALEELRREVEQQRGMNQPGVPVAATETPQAIAPEPEPAPAPAPEPPAAPALTQPQPEPVRPAKTSRHRKGPKPPQDEWGFFDPDQCGFAALLEKLEEITRTNDSAKEKRSA